jgi:hypothetical protein
MTIGDALFDARQSILFYIDSGHCFHPDDLPEISEVMLAMERLQLRLDYGDVAQLPDDAEASLKESLREYREHREKPETA